MAPSTGWYQQEVHQRKVCYIKPKTSCCHSVTLEAVWLSWAHSWWSSWLGNSCGETFRKHCCRESVKSLSSTQICDLFIIHLVTDSVHDGVGKVRIKLATKRWANKNIRQHESLVLSVRKKIKKLNYINMWQIEILWFVLISVLTEVKSLIQMSIK